MEGGIADMTEERKSRLDQYKEHCIVAEQKLFDVFQKLSAKESLTAADASALAAVAEAMVNVQTLRY